MSSPDAPPSMASRMSCMGPKPTDTSVRSDEVRDGRSVPGCGPWASSSGGPSATSPSRAWWRRRAITSRRSCSSRPPPPRRWPSTSGWCPTSPTRTATSACGSRPSSWRSGDGGCWSTRASATARRSAMPFWHQQSWGWLDTFEAAGFAVDGIDTVVHTHLHADHVGWDTRPDGGSWVPTFTTARHLYTEAGLEWLRDPGGYDNDNVLRDSVQPILDAGLADMVAEDEDLGDGSDCAPSTATRRATCRCGSSRRVRSASSAATSCTTPCSAPRRSGPRSAISTPTRRGDAPPDARRGGPHRRAVHRHALPDRGPPAGGAATAHAWRFVPA